MSIAFFILTLLTAFSLIAIPLSILWLISLFRPIVAGGGPYVPSNPETVEKMIRLANLTRDDVTVDLGSGDGRIVIAAAQAGAGRSIGYEIYPSLVKSSTQRIHSLGLADRAEIRCESMWDANLSGVTVLFLFQIPYALPRIKKLLESQLPPGARVISNDFKIPGWEPDISEDHVHLYTIRVA